MACAKYIRDDYYQWYRSIGSHTSEIDVIGSFLATDVAQCGATCFVEWVVDDSSDQYGANTTTFEKEDGIIIGSDTYSVHENGGPYVRIAQKEFVNLLGQWQKVFAQKPREIIIAENDSTYTVEGKN